MHCIKNKILHRDLKWANIFLNKDGTVKLGDLNVSKVAKMGLVYTQTGTPYYASPEVWQDKPYDYRSDIWSLGWVIYEMITLRPPFTATSMQELCNKVKKGSYPKIQDWYSRDLSTVLATLLKVSPLMRPSWEQILHMPAVEEHLTDEETKEIWKDLLNTIKIPRNMSLLQQKLPASQYETDKVEEKDEDNYEEDFEHDDSGNKNKHLRDTEKSQMKSRKKSRDKTERVRRKQKGLPPTAPPAKLQNPPQTDRENSNPEGPTGQLDLLRREIDKRKESQEYKDQLIKKKRKNPKTTEVQDVAKEPKPQRYQMYRLHSREKQPTNLESKRRVADIYKMRAKEVALAEDKVERDLKNKYSDRLYNANQKYLLKNYSSINNEVPKNQMSNRSRDIIDPNNNAKLLEQMIGNVPSSNPKQVAQRYHPLSENYRGVDNKLSLQLANPTPTSNQYNMIGRAGSRGSNLSSVTPHSNRKELILSKLKENYKNVDITKHSYYVPPTGLRKMANISSQRSQPVLGGLRNNLAKRYMSNQYSIDHSGQSGLPPTGIISQKRGEISSVNKKSRMLPKQPSGKPMSAKVPTWWG